MDKITKQVLCAIEDCTFDCKKTKVEGYKEKGKSFYVSCDTIDDTVSYSLWMGNERVITVDGKSYMALVANIFVYYIKF